MFMPRRFIVSFFLFTLVVSSNHNLQAQTYLNNLQTFKEFKKLSGEPLSDKYSQVISVKVAVHIPSRQVYFISSSQYRYHFEFCIQELGYDKGNVGFNAENYFGPLQNRTYLLGNINYFESTGSWVLEISPFDNMDAESILMLYNQLKPKVFFGPKLRFLLNSTHTEALYDSHKLNIPVITTSEIFKNQNYQAISKFQGYGLLRILDENTNPDDLKPNEIVILKGSMINLPPVAGVITTGLQTPLSHLSILAINRKIPCIAYRNALSDSAILKLVGTNVHLKVKADTFYLVPSRFKTTSHHNQQLVVLKKDFTADSLISVQQLSPASVSYVGNKAANFGLLAKISNRSGFKVPESAFAIPFYYYEQHVKNSNADSLIAELLADTAIDKNPEMLRQKLKAIRKQIKISPIDTLFLAAVEKEIKSLGSYTRIRFRSSTNAEDMRGFSGAGLYDSKTGISGDSVKTIERAIKEVWASLWNYNAYLERSLFNIDQRSVAMGILVHRSFPDETANGVAITKNIYRPGNYGFVINIQAGNEAVVDPQHGLVCEQLVCYPRISSNLFKDKKIVEILTYSDLSPDALLLSENELIHLANALDKIKSAMYKNSSTRKAYLDFGLDIEFKIDGLNRTLYIDQVRIYND